MVAAPERLSKKGRSIVIAPDNEPVRSAASTWKIAIKFALGQLTLFEIGGGRADGQISLALAGRGLAQEVARASDVLLDQLIEGFVEREALAELLDLISPMVRSVCVGVLVGGIGRIVHSGGLPFGAGGCDSCAVSRLSRARG